MKSFTRAAVLLMAMLLMAALFLADGCKRKKTEKFVDSSSLYVNSEKTPVFSARGFAAFQNAPLYDLSSGDPRWVNAPDFGEELELDPVEIKKNINLNKPVAFNPKEVIINEEYAYLIPVVWKNERCWIKASHYGQTNSKIGVVLETNVVSNSSGDEFLRKGDLAVFHNEDDTIIISPFVAEFSRHFIETNFSFNAYDVGAAKLLAKARAARDSERAAGFLKEAAEQYPSSALFPLISEMLAPSKKTAAMESLVTVFATEAESAAVYKAPDFSSTVLRRLEQYTDVTTTERTAEQHTSKAGSARWYHIREPEDGWIFGLDLEGAD